MEGRVDVEVEALKLAAVGREATDVGSESADGVGVGEAEAEAFGALGHRRELDAGVVPGDRGGDDVARDDQRCRGVDLDGAHSGRHLPEGKCRDGSGRGRRGRPRHDAFLPSGDLGQGLFSACGVDVVGAEEGGGFQAGQGGTVDEAGQAL